MRNKTWLVERRSERAHARVPAKLLVNSESGNYVCKGAAIDSSDHGVRIQTSFPFLTPGQTVEVVLIGDPKRSVLCRVVWVGPHGSERAGQVGLEFLGSSAAEH
jgi:PilZ domain